MTNKLHTITEVADWLQVSSDTVRRLCRKGLPCLHVGRQVRFDRDRIKEWLEGRDGELVLDQELPQSPFCHLQTGPQVSRVRVLAQGPFPVPLENPDFSRVRRICQDFIAVLVSGQEDRETIKDYIFQAVLEAVYGEGLREFLDVPAGESTDQE